MLLNEILQVNYKKSDKPSKIHGVGRSTDNFEKFTNIERKNPKTVVGSGCEAIVFHSSRPQNVGTVTKWLRNQRQNSNNNAYIKYLIKCQSINSTYVPRVYNITQYTRPKGIYEYAIQMEKLPISFVQYIRQYCDDAHLLRSILIQIFSEKYSEELVSKYCGTKYGLSFILTEVRNALESNYNVHGNINPQIISTLDLIHDLEGKNATLDIHGHNTMVRLTNMGPQLVITDPLLGK